MSEHGSLRNAGRAGRIDNGSQICRPNRAGERLELLVTFLRTFAHKAIHGEGSRIRERVHDHDFSLPPSAFECPRSFVVASRSKRTRRGHPNPSARKPFVRWSASDKWEQSRRPEEARQNPRLSTPDDSPREWQPDPPSLLPTLARLAQFPPHFDGTPCDETEPHPAGPRCMVTRRASRSTTAKKMSLRVSRFMRQAKRKAPTRNVLA